VHRPTGNAAAGLRVTGNLKPEAHCQWLPVAAQAACEAQSLAAAAAAAAGRDHRGHWLQPLPRHEFTVRGRIMALLAAAVIWKVGSCYVTCYITGGGLFHIFLLYNTLYAHVV
jgi:hypothetical protein